MELINVSDYYESTAIETIGFNDDTKQIQIKFLNNDNVYQYSVVDYRIVKETIMLRLNSMKDYPTSTNSIGSYISNLVRGEFFTLAA